MEVTFCSRAGVLGFFRFTGLSCRKVLAAFNFIREEVGFGIGVVTFAVVELFHEVGGGVEDFFGNGEVTEFFDIF